MENKTTQQLDPIYLDINPDHPVSEIESLCVNCEQNGVTRILITKIPCFKEIIIMAFTCPHCGYRSNEIETGTTLADHGIHFELNVTSQKDLNRRVIKSQYATIKIPECDLEIPPETQKGKLSTIEGFLMTTKDHFEASLNDGLYAEMEEDFITKIKSFLEKLNTALLGQSLPFQFILDDPSGNSFIENPYAPHTDPYIKVSYYQRTKEMAESMGYMVQPNENNEQPESNDVVIEPDKTQVSNGKEYVSSDYYDNKKKFIVYKSSSEISAHLIDFTKSIEEGTNINEEALKFPTNCYCCRSPGEVNMCMCTIPYFKEIIISCFKCEMCGYKTTDVKGGGGVAPKGTKITLQVKTKEDLNRDLYKSETSKIIIPEVGFESGSGSLGSMYTTVEGVIDKLIASIMDLPFSHGDSSGNELVQFCEKLTQLQLLNQEFTLIIDDPLSNSFIFPIGDPKDDTQLLKEEYERTWEQNEELGFNDMKVENYGETSESSANK